MFRDWKSRGVDPSEFLQAADIQGKNPESQKVEELNVLQDALVRTAHIPRESQRSRALDSGEAFKAIRKAYEQVEDDLPSDALEA